MVLGEDGDKYSVAESKEADGCLWKASLLPGELGVAITDGCTNPEKLGNKMGEVDLGPKSFDGRLHQRVPRLLGDPEEGVFMALGQLSPNLPEVVTPKLVGADLCFFRALRLEDPGGKDRKDGQ